MTEGLVSGTTEQQTTPHGVAASELSDADLDRELQHTHETRAETFRHGPVDALRMHTSRMAELEAEWLRRHPDREVDPRRLRDGHTAGSRGGGR